MPDNGWFLEFSLEVRGENAIGEEVKFKKIIRIPLFPASKKSAEAMARRAIAQISSAARKEDRDFFKEYYREIEDENGIAFSNFRLVFVKELEADCPEIVGGP